MMTNNKIKVLLCSPNGRNVGGISRWTGHIINYYLTKETNVNLIQYYPDRGSAYQDTKLIVRIYIGIISYLPYLYNLRKKFKTDNYDIAHFTSSASISLIRDIISLIIANKSGVKTVIHFRFGRIPEIFKKRNWEQRLIHKVITLANKVVVIDQSSYNTLIKQGYNNIELIPNPITPQVAEIIWNNPKIKRDDRKIVFAGHVVRTKGVFELIEACKTIKNIKLILIGYVTEEIKKELLSLVANDNSEWLEISGELSFECTIKEMLSAGVFVLPTYTEGFPNVIIESMACACPIVTTNVGAIPEMLDIEHGEKFGICVEPKNIDSLRAAIQKMLNDRKFALDCGNNARERVNELYSMPKIWSQLEAIWLS